MPQRKRPTREEFAEARTVIDPTNGMPLPKNVRHKAFEEPPRRFCRARTCTSELGGAKLVGPDGEETEFCNRHYQSILKNLVWMTWGPLELDAKVDS